MPTTNYATINGVLVGETGPNGTMYYHTDALGSVTMTTDQSSNVLNTYRYKPYGTQLSKTGTATDPKFTWVGSLGYRTTSRLHSEYYVRLRHYAQGEGSWSSVDPLWPNQSAYEYVTSSPASSSDVSGAASSKPVPCCVCGTVSISSTHLSIGPVFGIAFRGWVLLVTYTISFTPIQDTMSYGPKFKWREYGFDNGAPIVLRWSYRQSDQWDQLMKCSDAHKGSATACSGGPITCVITDTPGKPMGYPRHAGENWKMHLEVTILNTHVPKCNCANSDAVWDGVMRWTSTSYDPSDWEQSS